MNKNTKKKKAKKSLITRKGVMLVAILAVMILVINIITASYSWFSPATDNTHYGLNYAASASGRSENFDTLKTVQGTKSSVYTPSVVYKNQIQYGTTQPSSFNLTAGTTYYFKTEIKNLDENYGSDVSLYIKNMPAGTVAVTYPSNTVRTFTGGTQSDYVLIRNAYVKKKVETDVNGPGLLEVEWFITPSANYSNFNLSGNNALYLMFN